MPQAGYVYIVHGERTPFIKIGKTTNFFKRFTMLQEGVPFTLQILSVELVHDMDKSEEDLQERFAPYRSRGEWFVLPEILLQAWPVDVPLPNLVPDYSQIPSTRTPRGQQRLAALQWLEDYLQGDEAPAATLLAAAKAVGISEKTLRRARTLLDIRVVKHHGAWYWRLNRLLAEEA